MYVIVGGNFTSMYCVSDGREVGGVPGAQWSGCATASLLSADNGGGGRGRWTDIKEKKQREGNHKLKLLVRKQLE